jgi:hypothetical protein
MRSFATQTSRSSSPPERDRLISSGLRALAPQTKLTVNRPGDRYEQEAARIVDRVMRMKDLSEPSGLRSGSEGLQRMCAECEEEEQLQISTGTEARIRSLDDQGRPLPTGVRSYFEPRFGHDFSRVRVHANRGATMLAGRLNARAFTVGRHILFGNGQYAPNSRSGRHLLAHELTHVVQQTEFAGTGESAGAPTKHPRPWIQRDSPPEKQAPKSKATGPCGKPALAPTFLATDRAIKTVSVPGFGQTSRLAAYFTPGACLKGGSWSFFLKSLEVNVKSAVRPTRASGRALLHDSTPARFGPLSQLLFHDTTA